MKWSAGIPFPLRTALIAAAVVTVCGVGGYGSGTAEGAATARVYALMNPGDTPATLTQFAALPTVDGLVFRARWRDFWSTTLASYTWGTLNAAFETVKTHNKRLTVHIGASGSSPGTSPPNYLPNITWPDWLGAPTYTYLDLRSQKFLPDLVPWNSVFLSQHDSFVAALAQNIKDQNYLSLLNAISVGAPVPEMSLLGCRDYLLGGANNTTAVPYLPDYYLNAWTSTIGSYRTHFDPATPTILVSAPVSFICSPPDTDGSAFYTAVMTAVMPTTSNVAIFAADLNASGSSRVSQLDSSLRQQLGINLQMIWSSDDPIKMAGSLTDAVCQGRRLGARYFEIYKSDLLSTDPAIVNAIETARTGSGCPTYLLTTTVTGNGIITASAAGYSDLACGAGDCRQNYEGGSLVTLSISSGNGQTFTGWSGACSGTGSCTVTMDAERSVTASFADTAAPDTTITSLQVTSSDSVSVTSDFTASEAGSTFECSVNGGASWGQCSSPYNYSVGYAPCTTCRLDVPLWFAVRAKDQAGNFDLTPASYSWTGSYSLATPFANVVDGGVVQLKATDLTGDLNFSRAITLTVKGGYDDGYSANSGETRIQGTVTISGGTVILENITIL